MTPLIRSTCAVFIHALVLQSSPALAQGALPPASSMPSQEGADVPRLDIGMTAGFNNPGGIYGVETDFRLFKHLSVGVAGGLGAWGSRITPQVRLYPFGIDTSGLFLGGGLSLNLGGEASAEADGEVVQEADLAFTPVANASLGYRFSLKQHGWLALQAGYGFRLKDAEYTLRDSTVLDPLLEDVISLARPGGFMIGLSGGIALF